MNPLSDSLGTVGSYQGLTPGPTDPGILAGAGPTVVPPGLKPQSDQSGFLALLLRLLQSLGTGGAPGARPGFAAAPPSDR